MGASIDPSKTGRISDSLLIEEKIITTALTSYTFSDLDGDADGGYRIEWDRWWTTTAAGLALYINGDNTASNYGTELIQSTAGSIITVGYSFNQISEYGVWSSVGHAECSRSPESRFFFTAEESFALTGGGQGVGMYGGKNFASTANITSLTLTAISAVGADKPSGLNIGDKYRLYRRK